MTAVGAPASPTRGRGRTSGEPEPDGVGDRVRLWDDANIVESFSGVTLPLTYSVAREAYASVYRGACRALGVSEAVLDANADVFEQMIGHLDGRVYYNVSSWHRVLALLPGFGTSQGLLERMMGAARPGGRAGERAESVGARQAGPLDVAAVISRSGVGFLLFERRARVFERRIRVLALDARRRDVESMSIEGLLDYYDTIRTRALADWHVTIFNDLAVMVVHGALRRAVERWCGPAADPIVNRLLRTDALASAVPAAELRAIAARLRREPAWREAIDGADDPLALVRSDPALAGLRGLLDGYVDRWGDRCPNELQLDRPTFAEDPAPALAVVRALASVPEDPARDRPRRDRASDWADLAGTLLPAPRPVRLVRLRVLRRLVEMTRHRLRWRERMRFARTEVFAIGRRIFRSLDRRFVAAGIVERRGDVHYLDIAEIRGAIRGTVPPVDLGAIARDRRARFDLFAADPGRPSRFETIGPVYLARWGPDRAVADTEAPGDGGVADALELRGTPVCAGVVRGRCLPVDDPRNATPRPGQIIVARSTDPGWVPILASAAGLLVERGNLLSHSAIVARELGLPTIVGIAGLMAAVERGQVAEMDGSTGVVRLEGRVAPSPPAALEPSR